MGARELSVLEAFLFNLSDMGRILGLGWGRADQACARMANARWGPVRRCLKPSPQVLRDSRTKESSAGVEFTTEERKGWQSQLIDFFARPTQDGAAVKRRRKAAEAKTSRVWRRWIGCGA